MKINSIIIFKSEIYSEFFDRIYIIYYYFKMCYEDLRGKFSTKKFLVLLF